MKLYANPTITDFRQDVNGDIKMLKIGVDKEDAYANIQGQAEGKVENNKTATINVSTYTEPVEITPTSGKNSMKKSTVTLSNIPVGQPLYIWNLETGSDSVILAVGTFAEITVGMKGVACSAGSEHLFRGSVTQIESGVVTFSATEGDYHITISDEAVATAFPDLT